MQTAGLCATTQLLMLGFISLTVASLGFPNGRCSQHQHFSAVVDALGKIALRSVPLLSERQAHIPRTYVRSAREAVDPSQVCARKSSDSRFIANAGMFGRVLCDAQTDGGGWIVILRRFNGRVNFYRGWAEYEAGFGDVAGEFWMGNFNVFLLTSSGYFDLRVDMKFQEKPYYAKYSSFRLGAGNDNYRLHIAEFLGGDAGDSLSYHNNADFSTFDNDNNRHMLSGNCVIYARAPWWYKRCYKCLLFGQWKGLGSGKGVTWSTLTGDDKSLEFVEMKIRMNTQWY